MIGSVVLFLWAHIPAAARSEKDEELKDLHQSQHSDPDPQAQGTADIRQEPLHLLTAKRRQCQW